jgi:anaerobic magnesium-protoporphyrin IX monomethyl ester cyclase
MVLVLRVTLVNPPYPPDCHQHPPYLPLGLAYLGAVARRSGFEVNVIDAQALKLNCSQVQDRIEEVKPNVVGVTSTTLFYKPALEVTNLAKEACPDCTTVIGGCHVTFWDEQVFKDSPNVDVIVRSEGELTFVELLEKIENRGPLSDVLGITYKDRNGGIHRNQDRLFIENLDELPYPAYDLFPLEKYKAYGRIEYPAQTSRGCVFDCAFCSTVRMNGRKYRIRDPTKVADEIEFLTKEYGATYVGFVDDNFTLNPAKTKILLDEFQKRRIRIDYDCQCRVDVVTKELLFDMAKSGCHLILFGVESGCESLMEAVGKQATLDQARTAFRLADEAGIIRVASVLFGFPGETRETLEKTIKFIIGLNPDSVLYSVATPYPGTPLRDLVQKMGWLQVTDWNKYDTATPTFETPQLKIADLLEMKEKAYKKFYLRPRHVMHMLLKRNAFSYAEVKTSYAWLLRSLGLMHRG